MIKSGGFRLRAPYLIYFTNFILVLDPCLKLSYHKDHGWEERYITEARNTINDLYKTVYAPSMDQDIQMEEINVENDLLNHIYKKRQRSETESELDLYLGSPVVPGEVDLLQWWKVISYINFSILQFIFSKLFYN